MKQAEAIQHARNLASLSYNQGILEGLRDKVQRKEEDWDSDLQLSRDELKVLGRSIGSSLDVIKQSKLAIIEVMEAPQRKPQTKVRKRGRKTKK